MKSLQTAQRLVARNCPVLGTEQRPISKALGFVLAEDVRSLVPLPGFDNSAMDGFAVRAKDTSRASADRPVRAAVSFVVYAGDGTPRVLKAGEACRIMTGAPLPRGADAVIPKENAVLEDNSLVIRRPVARLQHVRRRGEEIKRGARVLKKGTFIHPGVVACLAAVGRDAVVVHRKPIVSVISTGSESVAPGTGVAAGQIYDSNSYMAAAMLAQMGIEPLSVRHVKDKPSALSKAVDAALALSDVLIVLGGVSVGDRDYVRPVLEQRGVEKVFWRVKQKPGKPIYFGKKGSRVVFGLPGNPASSFTCFYMYVYPALRRMSGLRGVALKQTTLPITETVTPDAERWLLLKGKTRLTPKPAVEKLSRQGSHMLTSLVQADSLIVVPSSGKRVGKGTRLTTYRLPYSEEMDS